MTHLLDNKLTATLEPADANALARELGTWMVLEGDTITHLEFAYEAPTSPDMARVRKQMETMRRHAAVLDQLDWSVSHVAPVSIQITEEDLLACAEILHNSAWGARFSDDADQREREHAMEALHAARVLAAAMGTLATA